MASFISILLYIWQVCLLASYNLNSYRIYLQMQHQFTHSSSCIIIRCWVKVCHVSRVTWYLCTVVFTVTHWCSALSAHSRVASLEVDTLFYCACVTSFRLYTKKFLAPFPSSGCLVLKTALVNTLNPCTRIWVEQLMNTMMKFSQNRSTQPSLCGTKIGKTQ